ncbi:membrane protease YdiL (CAAX protease family) [Bradyrhizobium sp. USDA 4341]
MSVGATLADLAPEKRVGALASVGWLAIVFALSQLIGLGVIFLFGLAGLLGSSNLLDNGPLLAMSAVAGFLPQVFSLLAIANRYSGGTAQVLGLVRPAHLRPVAAFLVLMAVFLLVSDFLVHLSGRPIVSEFQVLSYGSAEESGIVMMVFYWLAIALCAPVVEEMMFRGLAFSGWIPVIGVLPAVLLTDLAWTSLHLQYDLAGMVEVFAAGLLLSTARIACGSLWVPIAMHVLMNAWAVFETAIGAKWPW